jgi:hypothetical protein
VHLVGFIIRKFIMMYGHMNVNIEVVVTQEVPCQNAVGIPCLIYLSHMPSLANPHTFQYSDDLYKSQSPLLHHKPVPSEAYLSSFVKSKYFPATLVI